MNADSPELIKRTIGRGARFALIAKLAAKAAALLMAVVLARKLSVEDYGTFVLVTTWLLLLMIFGVMGLDTAAVRFVAQYTVGERGADKVKTFVRWAGKRVFLASCVIAFIASLVVLTVRGGTQGIDPYLIGVAAVTLPFLALAHFQQFVLRGLRLVGRAEAVGQIIRPVIVVVLVVIASLSAIELTDTRALVALLMGTSVSVVAGVLWLRGSIGATASVSATSEDARLWSNTAMPMMLITTSHFLLHQLDVLMLGSIAGAETVAPYAVASRLADVVAFSLAVASSIVAPMISSLYHSGRKSELQQMLRMSGRWVSSVALVVAGFLVLGPVDFLAFFGDAYTAAYSVLLILIFGQLLNAVTGPVGFLLSMTGNQRGSAMILGSGVAINAVLNLLLIPLYHELGAAVATAVTTIFWNIAMTVYASRKLGLRATPF